MSLDELTQTVIALPEEDRRTLIDTLIDSLAEEEAWDDDIDHDGPGAPPALTDEEITAISIQRLEDYDAGRAGAVDARDVIARLRERYK